MFVNQPSNGWLIFSILVDILLLLFKYYFYLSFTNDINCLMTKKPI